MLRFRKVSPLTSLNDAFAHDIPSTPQQIARSSRQDPRAHHCDALAKRGHRRRDCADRLFAVADWGPMFKQSGAVAGQSIRRDTL